MSTEPISIPDVVDVEWLRGASAAPDAAPDLCVEVPHGADERVHYDRLRGALRGADLPADLHCFFHVNTDVGAWAYGRRTAELFVRARPAASVVLVRSLIPRTFIDCNRPIDAASLGTAQRAEITGRLTPGVPPYVRDPADLALLVDRHRRYVEVARAAIERACSRGGLALIPHTYGPHTLGIDAIDDRIVDNLRWAVAPERIDTWPLRPEIDLLTQAGDGPELSPPGLAAELVAAFGAAGMDARTNETYDLHPGSLAHDWSHAFPGRVLCIEVRRDLLVDRWKPLEEMSALPEKVETVARVLARSLVACSTSGAAR